MYSLSFGVKLKTKHKYNHPCKLFTDMLKFCNINTNSSLLDC